MLTLLSAAEIAASVRSGERTAREYVEESLSRIDRVDARLNAFQKLRTFEALAEADEVDRRPDRAALPLAGVPVAIKDNVAVRGEPMRDGSLGSDPTPQDHDHEVVRRLRAAGAVVVGLTRVPELCIWGATDSAFGVTHNPWDRARTPGGSSGGSAAAVAAGMVPIALGNDGMGSIRIPSACCGLVGIKPGLGVVPSDLGKGSWFEMAENGALATTVADTALMFSVLAGRTEPTAPIAETGLRIAVSTKVPAPLTPLDRHWAAATRETADLLRTAGHDVTSADPPYDLGLTVAELTQWTAGTELDAQLLRDRTQLTTPARRHAAVGRMALRLGLPKPGLRERWRARAERFFADFDVLLTPMLAQPPIEAKLWSQRGWVMNLTANLRYAPFAAPWNVAGWPAMAVPGGLDPGGLPLSVQLVGRPGTEERLLGLAAQLEQLRPWPRIAEPMALSGS